MVVSVIIQLVYMRALHIKHHVARQMSHPNNMVNMLLVTPITCADKRMQTCRSLEESTPSRESLEADTALLCAKGHIEATLSSCLLASKPVLLTST